MSKTDELKRREASAEGCTCKIVPHGQEMWLDMNGDVIEPDDPASPPKEKWEPRELINTFAGEKRPAPAQNGMTKCSRCGQVKMHPREYQAFLDCDNCGLSVPAPAQGEMTEKERADRLERMVDTLAETNVELMGKNHTSLSALRQAREAIEAWRLNRAGAHEDLKAALSAIDKVLGEDEYQKYHKAVVDECVRLTAEKHREFFNGMDYRDEWKSGIPPDECADGNVDATDWEPEGEQG